MNQLWGTVVSFDDKNCHEDIQELRVRIDGRETEERAVCYPLLAGKVALGERVLLNTTAIDLGLGTGGRHFVIAREDAEVNQPAPLGGHIMKGRYLPQQCDVLTVEDPLSPYHQMMEELDCLDGMPVVCCSLHSQFPLVAAAAKAVNPALKIVYCMTDEAALMYSFSRVARQCRETGLIAASITCGQAMGGDYEAVSLHSGLLFARHVLGAHMCIVAIGPGTVGTGTAFGHTGLAQGEAINATAALNGNPIAALRVSFGDARERHRGVSHHSCTALGKVALAPATVPMPRYASAEEMARVEADCASACLWDKHACVKVDVPADIDMHGIRVTTMGRDITQDPAFFSFAFASGIYAAQCIS